MTDINYEAYHKSSDDEKVAQLIAFGIRRENAEKMVYNLDRPYVFK